ncbi:MAG TPA: polysaccharide deacetylase family protein [Vicinamibacteria bacterium]
MKHLVRQAREIYEVPRDILLKRYPPFVTGGPLPRGDVPVFVFHGLEPDSFGRKLDYLADNGYQTLSSTEYLEVLTGARPAPERAVVLTFDDGRGSLWTVGQPLLERHRMKGIVFVVPGRVPSRSGPRPPAGDDTFLSWEEIAALGRKGLLEFQSHTQRHARIHTAPEVVGFLTPEMRRGYAAMDVPLIDEKGADLLAADVPLGTPLLRSEPRTSEALRFREDPEIRHACVRLVAEEGGERFFARAGWARRLWRLVRGRRVAGRQETAADREDAIRFELTEARRELEERTPHAVIHLCYPWHVAGPTARRLAREAGYRTAFCGKVPGVPITRPGGDLERIARVGEDYVELLPGHGRQSLTSVLARKWSRRFGGRT